MIIRGEQIVADNVHMKILHNFKRDIRNRLFAVIGFIMAMYLSSDITTMINTDAVVREYVI